MSKSDPIQTLVALALDLLAHTEAQYREARRLDAATQVLVHDDRRQAEQIREHLRGLRRMSEEQRTLVEDFHREFDVWVGQR
ncbi:MAG TPA: hypothetical protein VFX12_16250 [Vicinamibacterales bacterium]|nr:hypothetical protein [Vicinamibacterales bacterium]